MDTATTHSSVFICYSRKDGKWLDALSTMLAPVVRAGIASIWWDRKIKPSQIWRQEIAEALASARLAILLVSPNFLASDFIQDEELPFLLDAARRQRVKLLWVLVSPCLHEYSPLRHIQAALEPLRPLSKLRGADRQEALVSISRAVVEALAPEAPDLAPLGVQTLGAEEISTEMADRPPYRGIEVFRTEDADLFFGRTTLTAHLIERLRESPFLALVGPSGSGKSSLVYAGLIPALGKGAISGSAEWRIVPVKPGRSPLKDLAGRLSEFFVSHQESFNDWQEDFALAMYKNNGALKAQIERLAPMHFLVVVDQCEAIFTQGSTELERQAFFINLLNASGPSSAKVTVVLILRADFYAHLDAFPELADRIAARQVYVSSLQENDLRQAIIRPAQQAGLRFEEGLAERILAEMRGYIEAMPLLQQALRELWNRREGLTLTFAAYRAIGEVKGAIANWAESAFEKLSTPQRELARRLLVELVQPGEDTPDTRRRVLRSELYLDPDRVLETEAIVEHLVQHRLLTADRDPSTREMSIELTHDALLQKWPELREWLEQSRTSRLTRKHLQERVRRWEHFHRDPGSLVDGPELAEYEILRRDHPGEVSVAQNEYVEACIGNRRVDSGLLNKTQSPPEWAMRRAQERTVDGPRGKPILDAQRPWDLAETGWGVVFAPNLDRRVRAALEELLDHRRSQAARYHSHYYRELTYQDGSAFDFLKRNGARPGMIADPDFLPYYLLLVGDPESLPYRFQSELDINYAVGRICFDRVDDYAAYARSVVVAETRNQPRPREVAFFGTAHKNDPASHKTSQDLINKLAESVRELRPEWRVQEVLGTQADKKKLRSLLGGPETPAFLFTACHGLGFDMDDDRQESCQGALVCQDWPGPEDEEGVNEAQWFAASDVSEEASLKGLVAFFFGCYSVGTPRHDNFDQTSLGKPRPITPKAFVSQLPQKLLAHRSGGMLALIGHLDRSWTEGFTGSLRGEGISAYKHMVRRLLQGHTVGWAMEYLNQSYASLAAMQGNVEEEWHRGNGVNADELAQLWRLRNDARNFMVFGDPAVRLPGLGEPR